MSGSKNLSSKLLCGKFWWIYVKIIGASELAEHTHLTLIASKQHKCLWWRYLQSFQLSINVTSPRTLRCSRNSNSRMRHCAPLLLVPIINFRRNKPYHPQSNFPYQTLFINQQRSNKNNPQTSWKTSSLNELSRKTSRKLLSGTHGPCLVRICSPPTLLRSRGGGVSSIGKCQPVQPTPTSSPPLSPTNQRKQKKAFVLIHKLLFLSFFFSFGGKFSRKTQSHRATSTNLRAIWCPVLLPWWQKKTERKNEHDIKVIRRTNFPRTASAIKVRLPVVTSRVTLRHSCHGQWKSYRLVWAL